MLISITSSDRDTIGDTFGASLSVSEILLRGTSLSAIVFYAQSVSIIGDRFERENIQAYIVSIWTIAFLAISIVGDIFRVSLTTPSVVSASAHCLHCSVPKNCTS